MTKMLTFQTQKHKPSANKQIGEDLDAHPL